MEGAESHVTDAITASGNKSCRMINNLPTTLPLASPQSIIIAVATRHQTAGSLVYRPDLKALSLSDAPPLHPSTHHCVQSKDGALSCAHHLQHPPQSA